MMLTSIVRRRRTATATHNGRLHESSQTGKGRQLAMMSRDMRRNLVVTILENTNSRGIVVTAPTRMHRLGARSRRHGRHVRL